MSYQAALEAAGATVHQFEEFGSYQGDWWARVTYHGELGWVNGSYGSCSGCDAFEAEFGWNEKEDTPEYQAKLAAFGKPYLEGLLNQEQAEKAAAENLSWDSGAQAMVDFVKQHSVNVHPEV